MNRKLLSFLLTVCVVAHAGDAKIAEFKTLHGNLDTPVGNSRTAVIEAPLEEDGFNNRSYRRKRDAGTMTDDRIITKINHLNDGHRQLMVHWAGDKSRVVICLARDAAHAAFVTPSKVYVSYDDGDTYTNRTEGFRTPEGGYATLTKFYNHPKFNTHFIFTDVDAKVLYVTTDYGTNVTRIPLNFTPSEISFHEMQPSTFVVLDKVDPHNKFWITEDFGKTFRLAHEFIKSFYWLKDSDEKMQLVVQRYEPNNMSSIIYSKTLFKNRESQIYATNVKDFFFKGDYLFTTKNNGKGELVLYVSYKLGRQLLCIFDLPLKFLTYFIVDVSGSRALVAVSHTNTSSNLYMSENLGGNDGQVKFTLSLEDVLAFLPGSTWQDTWLHHVADEAFADVYKVEGLQGIYIASRVLSKPSSSINSLGPQHLASVITFDHGATWRPVNPPPKDIEGQSTSCLPSKNCSLHLSQKFGQLFPETRWVTILSSKSAPGVIIATGVIGSSLKGHYGVYISLDAGLTWHQTLRGLYFFNMGDHGGILTGVEYYKSQGETRHIEYSIDEGETWNKTAFHNEELKLYGLMTEPGENKTVFTMFGSLPEQHQWIIVKVDLKNVFNTTCKDEDYKMWSPSQSTETRNYIPCVLGEQVTYQRRMPHALCLNGLNYVRVVSKQRCDCDYLDFECDFGFMKVGNPPRCILNKSLVNYDPYKPPSTCKPGLFYNRTKGYRKISGDVCLNGFESHFLPDQVPCPIKEMDDFILFAQRERISRFNIISKVHEELPVKNVKNVVAIDFDLTENCVYWADIAVDVVARQCFSNGSETESLVSTDLSSIEGMAFDWISKTLYFVDGGRAKIELIRTDIHHGGRMRRTILNSTVLQKPRGIALHPPAGYMFWTDWSHENPSINRANLDGSKNIILFGKDKVQWPNGVTIDYIANRIYWVDAHRDYIGSSDLHGDGYKQVVANSEMVAHPFAIAVFKNNMYWDDWKKNSIFSADKDSFKGVEILVKQMPGLMDLKIFAHGLQIGSNACVNTTCPYICVGLPKNKSACLCPDGLTMKNGKCICPGGAVASNNLTCPSVGDTCGTDHFTCHNSVCIPKGWRCDGEDDCGDNSDEMRCMSANTCPPSFFVCKSDGRCIPSYWKCDYDNDCVDGSDELGCPKQNCTAGQFACQNGRCISGKWRCDGENDCRDGSDERNCNQNVPTSCKSEEFECKDGSVTCIPSTWKCDQEPDCRDGSDENDCDNNKCMEGQFSCGPPHNRCIYSAWVCDGDKDCPDGRDEANCTAAGILPKPEIPNQSFNSKNNTCQDWMFKCLNARCMPFWWKCDGIDDCGDGSDEVGCPPTYPLPGTPSTTSTTLKPIPTRCETNQFRCASGKCISASWVCDGMNDCPGREDEADCDRSYNCSGRQFKCKIDGSCIDLSSVCDGHFDCPDKTDESACEQHNLPPNGGAPATPSCSFGFFPCDDGTCHPLAVLCDGKIDCKDGYDEMDCNKKTRVYQVMQIDVDDRGVNDTAIGLYWWIQKPNNFKLQYMPAISKVGDNKWVNKSWTDDMEYEFSGLEPFTKYNMTVYVRIKDSKTVYPPAKYLIFSTVEGYPSEPWNVTVRQRNGSHILISWNKPNKPRGFIKFYEICWSFANSSEFRLKLTGNETSHLLSPDFQHNVTYTFWVIAHNGYYASNKSEPAKLVFDGETNVTHVKDITVSNSTEDSISLSWRYDDVADGFNVTVLTDNMYPDLPVQTTKTKNITLKLAPGTTYYIEINAFKKGLVGPISQITIKKSGQQLPMLNTLQVILMKDIGTTVKLSWEMPKYTKKFNWMYGVYYGITREELFAKPRFVTMNTTATISNLEACEIYTFSVGLVGPLGYGPLSPVFRQVSTSENPRAPPKQVQVTADGDNPLKMKLQFVPSCPTSRPKFYIIKVMEKGTTQTWHVKIDATESLTRTFDVLYGGVYEVSVATDESNAMYSRPVIYKAPAVPAPHEIKVPVYDNGSFVVWWKERKIDVGAGRYKYEVLVQEGRNLNESLAQRFVVDGPPFVYTNSSAPMYTFAVRIKTGKGLNSQTSELITKFNDRLVLPEHETNLSAVLVPCLLVMIVLIGAVAFLVVRNRRLHSSFTRFTNSHYDTRSDAATFDNNGLDEEESPQIRGFSDDEPLVIA